MHPIPETSPRPREGRCARAPSICLSRAAARYAWRRLRGVLLHAAGAAPGSWDRWPLFILHRAPGDNHSLNLTGPLVDLGDLGVAEVAFDGEFLAVTDPTM